jgi:superfamily II DNA helicase RecQ
MIRYGERLVGLVVEEAHVVGQWQDDFREDYRKLPELRALTRAPWSFFFGHAGREGSAHSKN